MHTDASDTINLRSNQAIKRKRELEDGQATPRRKSSPPVKVEPPDSDEDTEATKQESLRLLGTPATPSAKKIAHDDLSKDEIIERLHRRALLAESMVEALEERLVQAGAPVLHWVGPDAQLPDDFPTPKKGPIWKGLIHKDEKSFCAACGQEIPEDKRDEEDGRWEGARRYDVADREVYLEATSSPSAWYSP